MAKSTMLEGACALKLNLKDGMLIRLFDRETGGALAIQEFRRTLRVDPHTNRRQPQWSVVIHAPDWIRVDRPHEEVPHEQHLR